ncbi:hypothetical protein YC2023_078164 [Brassica napus]
MGLRQVFLTLTVTTIGISGVSSSAPDSSKAKSAAASIFRIIDRKSKIDTRDESGMVLENVKGDIEFCHISFAYQTRPDIQIFRDLCFFIRAGKTVALVGESGSGKSTVISLLQRFYDPDSGHITLDGVELKKLQLKWLRQQMGLVGQEPVLFNDTIRANIAYGKGGEEATEAEIVAASELSNAHKFISSIQKGYDTVVGERGIQLSGGQKQRVAIARAIVKEPKILLLDEATSALDAESERVVQDALDRVMVNRTTIVVAHRLSTIKNADIIAVVENGMIVEKGTHETLMNIEGGENQFAVQQGLSDQTQGGPQPVTGRAINELERPPDLWGSCWGRSILSSADRHSEEWLLISPRSGIAGSSIGSLAGFGGGASCPELSLQVLNHKMIGVAHSHGKNGNPSSSFGSTELVGGPDVFGAPLCSSVYSADLFPTCG